MIIKAKNKKSYWESDREATNLGVTVDNTVHQEEKLAVWRHRPPCNVIAQLAIHSIQRYIMEENLSMKTI